MGDPQLGRDNVARDAVGLAEVSVSRRDDAPAQGPIVGVIEELDDLFGHRSLEIAATVGGHDEHVLVGHAQGFILGKQRDSRRREAELFDKTAGVARRRREVDDDAHDDPSCLAGY